MDQSLSVILPVHNAETTLARQIHELLEVLPELTSRFEVLIVDDGSTDHTEEVAYDLAREFPQLQVARHAQRRGAVGAVETGLEHASGDILLVSDEQTPLSSGELRRLWGTQESGELVKAGPLGRRGSRDGSSDRAAGGVGRRLGRRLGSPNPPGPGNPHDSADAQLKPDSAKS